MPGFPRSLRPTRRARVDLRLLAVLAALALTPGCRALYEDLSPPPAAVEDSGPPPPPTPDAGPPPPGEDAGPPVTPPPEGAIAVATMSGRVGYSASGMATLERAPDGSLQVRLHEDFSVQSVPGPAVVLSRRPFLDGGIQEGEGDFNLGVLEANSGEQVYPAPEAAVDSLYVWIYCLPFRVEIARGDLVAVEDPGPPDPPPPSDPTPIADATMAGRSSYQASGMVSLERTPEGQLQVRFHEDFSTQSVPGPVVVLSRRDNLDGGLDEAMGDYNAGVLRETSGAQTYAVPDSVVDASYVWVYCLPFTVEIARGDLIPAG